MFKCLVVMQTHRDMSNQGVMFVQYYEYIQDFWNEKRWTKVFVHLAFFLCFGKVLAWPFPPSPSSLTHTLPAPVVRLCLPFFMGSSKRPHFSE